MLSPITGLAGAAATLTVTGTNFASDAVVSFNGQKLPTMRQPDGTLRANVAATVTAQAGQYSVWVENGGGASRSNVLYFTVNPMPGAPMVVDYTPDNGQPGDKVLIVGKDLDGTGLKISDPKGLPATPGAVGMTTYLGAVLPTVEFTVPQGWSTGPITFANARGSYQGKIFNVGRNLSALPGVMLSASSEYGGSWPMSKGADNILVTSWFTRHGDCASIMSCTLVPWFKVSFPAPQAVVRITMRGNREYMSGYDFLRGTFELLGAGNAVLWSASYDLPEPDRDLDIALPEAIPGVTAVKFSSLKDESDEPGFAELEVFGP
jgi:hypothetical protein